MLKTNLAILLSALLLGGCVYERSEAPLPREGAPPPAEAAAPPPDRVRAEDLARLNPGTGTPGPEAGTTRFAHTTPHPPRIFVQAASFVIREQAERTRRSLAGLGPAGVYTAYVDDRLRYRVRIGPLATPERSERVRAVLVRRGYSDAIILRD